MGTREPFKISHQRFPVFRGWYITEIEGLVFISRTDKQVTWNLDKLGLNLNKAWVKGLWSVNIVNSLPSSMKRKCKQPAGLCQRRNTSRCQTIFWRRMQEETRIYLTAAVVEQLQFANLKLQQTDGLGEPTQEQMRGALRLVKQS